ncbi:MAG: acyl-CoA desaturase [Gammaproteobacteria bacterium]|nr:MAG: acyl-CoA desaturase [Gammaproteobacteria bacterium]
MLSHGLVDLPWWGYVLVALGLTHVTIASVTIFLHRHQAHRALDLHPVLSHFFRFWLWLTTGMVTKEWAAVHRKHHARCETEEDPHSPQVLGLRKVLLEGAELYRQEARNPQTLEQYGKGTPDDWLERHLYTPHNKLGIGLMLGIDLLLFGPIGLTLWAVQMIWIPFFAAGVINGVGHYWGYRNFQSPDASTNIVPWGILIGGEELHNNHHAFPASAKLSVRPWELDIGWLYIRIAEALGLARVRKVAPQLVIDPAKQEVDGETVQAVLVNRFHLVSGYVRQVILPVLREELRRADDSCRRLLRRAKRPLVRGEAVMDDRDRSTLQSALGRSQSLRTVYEYKQRLQELWQRRAGPAELAQQLREWCQQAEASGIRYLQDFARSVRGLSLAPSGRA